eukprot:1152029-Alexandrium_andersonii.AAC.1
MDPFASTSGPSCLLWPAGALEGLQRRKTVKLHSRRPRPARVTGLPGRGWGRGSSARSLGSE